MSRVVHLHIGAPKTGTTYLQDRLRINAPSLARHGVTIPATRPGTSDMFHFRAALDLLDQDWGGSPGHAKGAWDAMVRRVRRAEGNVVISHEILAGAKPDKIAKAMNDLAGNDVHIVYSARDLARQVPAAWQESIKQGRKWGFNRFLNRYEGGKPFFFRQALDLPEVLTAWGSKMSPDRIHVVTVPHDRGPDGDELWQRFCRAFGIDPAWAPLDSERDNRSLGIAETSLLRKLNRRLELGMHRDATYDNLIREILAQEVLVARDAIPVRLPPERYDFAEEQGERWIEWIKGSGVDVVGDLDDLRPRRPAEDEEWRNPDRVRAKLELSAALDALTVMTKEAAEAGAKGGPMTKRVRTAARRLRDR
ncbi:hypothetical protein EUA93_07075 [Nocardioides oleivorans]|uniref:Sulfotransferase family protein n=1 Tax=Nocardioides oleivorans TaxID=273676 RepID=A0A4Q2S164_9ACTN|nr:hypothetical protein [Nocardioides oleivorans]RYB94125.1 hypothetical protein EUA93_07075 [Nocardioides oleivorans]